MYFNVESVILSVRILDCYYLQPAKPYVISHAFLLKDLKVENASKRIIMRTESKVFCGAKLYMDSYFLLDLFLIQHFFLHE